MAWTPKPFKYRPPFRGRQPYQPVNRAVAEPADEELTGLITDASGRAQQASDIEERFARALDKNNRVRSYIFRRTFIAPMNIAGSVEVDFLVEAGDTTPVQIDGDFAHKTAEAKAHDAVQDARLDEHLRATGEASRPTVRVPGSDLENQDEADLLVMGMF